MKRPRAQSGDLPGAHLALRLAVLVFVVAAFITGTVLLLASSAPERLVTLGGDLWSAAREWVFG
jgi:hypothetical protein